MPQWQGSTNKLLQCPPPLTEHGYTSAFENTPAKTLTQHAHNHSHEHVSLDNRDSVQRVRWALLLTALFMVVEVVGGLISGSLALLADAGHMLTDSAALALALFAFKMSDRPADGKRTFGYQRMQVLAAFVNALTLLAIVAWIVIEAIQRLMEPPQIMAGTMFAVAVGGLIVNLLVFRILHGGDQDNLNMHGATLHVLGDMLGSVAAIVAASVIWFTNWTPVDPILSVLVAALILRSAWRLLRNSGHILMEGAPAAIDRDELRERLVTAAPEVSDIHHVHVWSLNAEERMLTMHAEIREDSNQYELLVRMKAILASEFAIQHSTIEFDIGACADQHSDCDD